MKRFAEEYVIVHDVQKNLIAILNMKLPRERPNIRTEVESLVRDSPGNLNALADLEYLYRGLNRNKTPINANQYKKGHEYQFNFQCKTYSDMLD